MRLWPHITLVAGLIAILAGLPWVTAPYVVTFLFLLFMYLVLAQSYDILGGHLNYLNLGHSSFFGIGAYAFGALLSRGLALPLAFLAAIVLAALFASAMSYPFFRLRGAYFSLATFALIKALELLAFNLKGLTGGSDGLSIPSGYRLLPAYYSSLLLGIVTVYVVFRISHSRFGLALHCIREDEEVAHATGIGVFKFKCLALILSSLFASLMGAIYTWYIIYINPSSVLGLEIALVPVAMAMLGGTGTILGPMVGVAFLTVIEELLWTQIPYLHLATYGLVLVLVGCFMPGGMVRTRWFAKLAGMVAVR